MQNNVTRMLESKGIEFDAFELPAEKLGALEAAEIIGASPEQVFKTIVVKRQGRGKAILAVVPGDRDVDLKGLAKALDEKKVLLTTQREAEEITGLQAGGISPLALINKGFQVVIDLTAKDFGQVYVSGGQRGLNLRLQAVDLANLTNARFADISSRV